MEQEKFDRISEEGLSNLQALMSPLVGALGGMAITYNAYFRGREVVVVGYQRPSEDGKGTLTKPIAILIEEELFSELRVDDEASRVDGDGQTVEKKIL